MKKILAALTALCLLLGCAAFALAEPETLTGTAAGMYGDVTVEVVVNDGVIESVTVTQQQETPGVGTVAVEQLPEKIVARARESLASAPPAAAAAAAPQSLKSFLKNKEKEYLSRILADSDGDKEKAAKTLQVSLATLYRKISDDAPAASK